MGMEPKGRRSDFASRRGIFSPPVATRRTATARPKPPPPLMDTGSAGDSGWGAGHRELNLDKIPF